MRDNRDELIEDIAPVIRKMCNILAYLIVWNALNTAIVIALLVTK